MNGCDHSIILSRRLQHSLFTKSWREKAIEEICRVTVGGETHGIRLPVHRGDSELSERGTGPVKKLGGASRRQLCNQKYF